MKVEFKSSVLY